MELFYSEIHKKKKKKAKSIEHQNLNSMFKVSIKSEGLASDFPNKIKKG